MGKMLTALIMVILIEFSLGLFVSCIPADGVVCENKTSLFTFILDPQDWSLIGFIDLILDNTLLIAGSSLIIAGFLLTPRYDFVIYAGIAFVFVSFGQTLYFLWQQLAALGLFGDAAPIIASLILAGPLIYFIIAVLDFIRGRD